MVPETEREPRSWVSVFGRVVAAGSLLLFPVPPVLAVVRPYDALRGGEAARPSPGEWPTASRGRGRSFK